MRGHETLQSAVIVLTDQGLATGQRIIHGFLQESPENVKRFGSLGQTLSSRTEVPELWVHKKCQTALTETGEGYHRFERLTEILPDLWRKTSLLIFVMATGIVIRQIASLLQSKDRDPAILVLDEKGQFVISLLSGHLGGANAWTYELAQRLKAQPVITTATDVQGLIAPDEYARRLGWEVAPVHGIKAVNRYLLDKGYLKVWSEVELSPEHPLCLDPHYDFVKTEEKENAQIWITPSPGVDWSRDHARITLTPKILSIGVGSRRGISKERVLEAIHEALLKIGASEQSIFGIFSIDLKREETGIIEAAIELEVPFRTFAAEDIQGVVDQQGLSQSEYVKEKIGVDGVCEAASLLGTRQGELILSKQKHQGVTVAISREKSSL